MLVACIKVLPIVSTRSGLSTPCTFTYSRVMSILTASTFAVGLQFDTMKDLRLACEALAIQENFEIKTDHADKRYRIHCISSERCPWRLHASSITTDKTSSSNIVEIKALTPSELYTYERTLSYSGICTSLHTHFDISLNETTNFGLLPITVQAGCPND